MSAARLESAPVLSTPDTHILDECKPKVDTRTLSKLSDEQLYITYEIQRTVKEIRAGKWRRIALQFPDEMLPDATRVYKELGRRLRDERATARAQSLGSGNGRDALHSLESNMSEVSINDTDLAKDVEEKLYILGDTSYGACCVDEIAAEHVDADVVVHYGRACLSPTARMPVIYVFTTRPLSISDAVEAFRATYPDLSTKVILMADLPYQFHLSSLQSALQAAGYTNTFPTTVIHDPSAPLPNRALPAAFPTDLSALQSSSLFHLGQPPTALLLALHSRLHSLHIHDGAHTPPTTTATSSAPALKRRYALLTRVASAGTLGIVVTAPSQRGTGAQLARVRRAVAAAGKKSYAMAVGKINAAKLANFADVAAWVAVGCWESSLVEEGPDRFFAPVVTAWEAEVALMGDGRRVWDGRWAWDGNGDEVGGGVERDSAHEEHGPNEQGVDGDESAPPEFDLRSGRYVSFSRPMRNTMNDSGDANGEGGQASSATALVKRPDMDVAQVGGVVSPAAEFLRSKRTWQGLGSDFDVAEREGALVEEGRSGIARGYTVGDDESKH